MFLACYFNTDRCHCIAEKRLSVPTFDKEIERELIALLPRLRRFCIGLCGGFPDGDDLTQAALERGLANIHQWQVGSRLDSWLFRIARNLFLNKLRAERVRRGHLQMVRNQQADVIDGAAQAAARLELGVVLGELGRLPEEQRSVLLLVAVEGLSYRETAEVMDLPIGTVTSRVARARKALQLCLAEEKMSSEADKEERRS